MDRNKKLEVTAMSDRGEFVEKNDIIQAINNRKSVRSYTEREITAAERELILTAALNAPSPGNQQLYTILDITDENLKQRLSVSCDYQPFIAEAKMVLVFCADCLKWYEAYRDVSAQPRKPGVGDLMLAVSDANIAAQTAVIAAESLGIGSCYIGDIMENCETQREILGLPEYVFPAAMVVFGYGTEQQLTRKKPPRPDVNRVVFKNTYPQLGKEERKELFKHKAGNQDYISWMKAFCARKYNSDFSVEMSRSVGEYLKEYER